MKKLVCIFLLLVSSVMAGAWDGYDCCSMEVVEIGRGNLVRTGKEIEVYHWDDGSYHCEEVQGMCGNEPETYDYEDGEYHYYEMD